MKKGNVLEIKDLSVDFMTVRGIVYAVQGLNIPLHTTFYCFIKLLVNHAFTSFKPPFLFHVSQAYIYNSALSCTIRVRQIRRSHSISSPHVLPLVGRGASRCSMSLICWSAQDVLLSPECLCPHWQARKRGCDGSHEYGYV